MRLMGTAHSQKRWAALRQTACGGQLRWMRTGIRAVFMHLSPRTSGKRCGSFGSVHPHLSLHERGDTIVEVLISITIISMVLGGAYVTTNRSLLDTRDAQERSNAVKVVETQLEGLRTVAATNKAALFGSGVPASFCISGGVNVVTSSNSACAVDSTGTPTTAEPVYHLAITQSSSTSGSLIYTTFAVRATWASVLGQGQDTIQMSYRLNQS